MSSPIRLEWPAFNISEYPMNHTWGFNRTANPGWAPLVGIRLSSNGPLSKSDSVFVRYHNGTDMPDVVAVEIEMAKLICLLASVLSMVSFFLFRYCFECVVGTLTLVESSDGTSQFSRASKKVDDYDDQPSSPFASEEKRHRLMKDRDGSGHTPLTSSLRKTLRFLYYLGGVLGPFRGFHVLVVEYGVELMIFSAVTRTIGREAFQKWYIGPPIGVIVGVITSPLSLVRVHATITRSSASTRGVHAPRTISRLFSLDGLMSLIRLARWPRMPKRSALQHVVFPTAIAVGLDAFAQSVDLGYSYIEEGFLKPALGTRTYLGNQSHQPLIMTLMVASFVEKAFVFAAVFFFRFVPLGMLLPRVQASLLPGDQDAIVSFDRSYGSSTEARGPKESDQMSLLKAWQTLSWGTFWRIAKLHAITLLVTSLFIMSLDFAVCLSNKARFSALASHLDGLAYKTPLS